MTQRAKFSQVDVTRAVRAVKAAGETVSRVVIEHDGRIVVHCGMSLTVPDQANSLDRLLTTRRLHG